MPAPSRRWAVLVLPAALVALGLGARAGADRAFAAFTGYRPPFTFTSAAQRPGPALSPRVVLVLIDGLGLSASRGLPFLDALRARGASYGCSIGLPSLSLPARAVLMTGAWQELHGQATNYNPRPLTLEHLFALARAAGRGTALSAGDKTQLMFTPHVVGQRVLPEEPETAPFAHYEASLPRQVAAARELLATRAAFTVLELYLPDEAGHGWGSASPEYARAARLVDEAVRELAASIDLEKETLVVTADHGHVAAGGHGGPEPEVLAVPLVLAGRGVRRGVAGSCAQVDVAPTLAALMGLPLPAASQGRPLVEALDLDAAARRTVLDNAVLQRAAFVAQYTRSLRGQAAAVAGQRPSTAPAAARLDELAEAEARVRSERLRRDSGRRAPRALALALLPLLGVFGFARSRALEPSAVVVAGVAGLAGFALYHALLLPLGLGYSLTAVNKDEWLARFFVKDMVLGATACAAAGAAACLRLRARVTDWLGLSGVAWMAAAVFCCAFLVKIAFAYWRHDLFPTWAMPDQFWGMGFYLDALAVMAAGLSAPLLALVAGAVRLVPARA